jgi:hypothetical protein
MDLFLYAVTVTNMLLGAWIYYRFSKVKYLFGDRFGYTFVSATSSHTSLVLSINLYLLFPDHLSLISSLNIVMAIAIGILFGSLINAQSLLAGCYHGGMASIMGTMAGIVALDPTICGLPANLFNGETMILYFSVLTIFIQVFASILVAFTQRA